MEMRSGSVISSLDFNLSDRSLSPVQCFFFFLFFIIITLYRIVLFAFLARAKGSQGVNYSSLTVVRASVRAFILSNKKISASSEPIAIKFYLKHQRGKVALGLGHNRIGTLVSVASYEGEVRYL